MPLTPNTKRFSSLRWRALRLFNSGTRKSEDHATRTHIKITNLVFAASGLSTFFMALLFVAVGYSGQAISCFLNAAFLIIPFYLNYRGYHLLSKVISTIFVNCTLLLWCCLFTHHSVLNTYFLFMATSSIYIFRRTEGFWLSFMVFFSLACFFVESTDLKNYFPAYELVNTTHDLNITNIILLTGLICLLISHVGSFVFLSALREKKLNDTKKWLTISRKKLEQQNEDLKTFGAAASHFLQTPLYVCKVFVEKIRMANEVPYTEKDRQYFSLIDESLTQMEEFIKGLFSQYKIMEINTQYELIDVLEELQKIRIAVLQKFSGSEIILPQHAALIHTNRILLIIILQNVIENGLKYNTSKVPTIHIAFSSGAQLHSLAFTDNGIGIEDAYQRTIFNPFMRIDHYNYIGTGLGLAGAKRAAEAIGGDLFCESSSSAGSTFKLNIVVK